MYLALCEHFTGYLAQQSFNPNMSTAKISDIITTIPSLTKNGLNWSIFKMCFCLALMPYSLYHHIILDNKNVKPVDPLSSVAAGTTLTADQTKAKEQYDDDLAKWEKNSDTVWYILSRVILDSMLWKVYSDTRPVDLMWNMLSVEFEQKTSLIQADLHTKFHSYKCPEKGDIHVHLNQLWQMHQDLENIGIVIDDRDYATIIMQSVPSMYADFCANISAAAQLVWITITVDQLQHQLEQEYDWRKTHHVHATLKPKDATFNANSSNHQSGGQGKNREHTPGQKKELRCWNCDAVGHWKSECPKLLVEKAKKGEKKESANTANDVEVGSWMAIVHQSEELNNGDGCTEVTDSDWDFMSEHSKPSI